ncbi:MAG: hypothetical protein LBF12_04960 [Christensenellaceae bacterium]|jgi:hypothetical protein|nr:hypothetical protein [Christensenellaceae bacterium]
MNIKSSKKIALLIIQICLISLLSSLLLVGIFGIFNSYQQYSTKAGDYKYKAPTNTVPSYYTDSMSRKNVIKSVRISGQIIRSNNTIVEISMPHDATLNCVIGSIITNATDIADDNSEENYANGRVVNILKEENTQNIVIDLASNYLAILTLDDAYSNLIELLYQNKLVYEISANYADFNSTFIKADYDKKSSKYYLYFSVDELNSNIYLNIDISAEIIQRQYLKAVVLSFSVIKALTEDNKAVLDMLTKNRDGTVTIREVQLQIIDVANSDIILNTDDFVSNEFIIYNRYHPANQIPTKNEIYIIDDTFANLVY